MVVLDRDDRVLLLLARDPMVPAKGEWWEIPGGGMEPGESSGAAAARELFEETGIRDAAVGPAAWQHRARYRFAGMHFDQREHIHVARLDGRPSDVEDYRPGGLEAMEALAFSGLRWWTADELAAMVAEGGRVIPPWLPVELRRYLDEGPPAEPRDLGELPELF